MASRGVLTILLVVVVVGLAFLLLATQSGQISVPPSPIAVSTPIAALEGPSKEVVDLTKHAATGAADVIEGLLNQLTHAPKSEIVRILFVVAGAILLVAGWRIYDYLVIVAGFFVGAAIAVSLVSTENTVLSIAALLVGGLIGALLSHFMVLVAVFLIGAYLGIILTDALGVALKLAPVSSLALLIGGLIGGLILLRLSTEFLVIASALLGAQLIVLGLGLQPVWIAILTIAGLIVQFVAVRAFRYDFRGRRRPSLFRRSVPV